MLFSTCICCNPSLSMAPPAVYSTILFVLHTALLHHYYKFFLHAPAKFAVQEVTFFFTSSCNNLSIFPLLIWFFFHSLQFLVSWNSYVHPKDLITLRAPMLKAPSMGKLTDAESYNAIKSAKYSTHQKYVVPVFPPNLSIHTLRNS